MELKVFVEDIEVEGEIIHRSASDITVKIIKPFSNISIGSHIPCFIHSHKSFVGKDGDIAAKSLLKNIYGIAHHLEMEMFSIREKLDSAKDRIINLPVQFNTKDFNVKRRELKQLLKQNKIDSKVYQQQLTMLREKAEEFNQRVTVIMGTFFEEKYPMNIPYGTRKAVLDVIEGKKDLVAVSVK